MPDVLTRDELAHLRAEMAAMRAEHATELAALRRLVARPRRRRALLPALCLALLLALVPASILAAHPFTDLTGGVHDADIDAIYNAGVTTGCVPNAEYCPIANVTRQEMASFLARLGGLGGNPPVANARTAQSANDAALLQGYRANHLARVASDDDSALGIVGTEMDPDNVASVVITAPVHGYVLVHANMQVVNEVGAGCPCEVWMRLWHASANGEVSPQWAVATADNSGAFDSASIAWVFGVGPGDITFVAQAYRHSGISPALAGYAQISALFVPFGATGLPPLIEK